MAAERTCKVRPGIIARTLTTMQEQLGLESGGGQSDAGDAGDRECGEAVGKLR
jgi:hypothetical protein